MVINLFQKYWTEYSRDEQWDSIVTILIAPDTSPSPGCDRDLAKGWLKWDIHGGSGVMR